MAKEQPKGLLLRGRGYKPVARPAPTEAEDRESDALSRGLKEASDLAAPEPRFPAQTTRSKTQPEEAQSMATNDVGENGNGGGEEEDLKITAKKGSQVRVVHRRTDGGWRLWESGTNKMVVRKLFDSEQAAVRFAKKHEWDPVITGRREAAKPAPKAAKKKSARKRQAAA